MSCSPERRLDHLLSAVESELQKGSEKGDVTERDVRVALEDAELWMNFKELTNEMIVTKTGRRMFPVLRVSVSGLDPNAMYSVLLDFVAADSNRWKYVNGEWLPGGKPEPQSPSCVYIHADSPNFGAHWMKAPVSFSKVKLSNKVSGGGQIMLNSLHKYEPRIHIVKVGGVQKMISSQSFPETQFIAVTAYQNEEVTALKIKHNPFAKAFLDAKERSDHKDIVEHSGGNQQTGYAQIGSWILANNSPVCSSSSSSSPQFGGGYSHVPDSYCDRYSSPRSHRATPYSTHYQHHTPSTSSYMDSHESWSSLQIPSPGNMGSVPHTPSHATSHSQYPGLWSVTGSTLSTTAPPAGSLGGGGLTSHVSYTSLSSSSSAYDAGLPEGDSQLECSISRLTASWTTPMAQSY
ncbi:T-box transcription factor T-A-like [Denticeps clupeoides]|uniref:T-box transcription factor T-A-like n=1 Tax=Denticeps clupeoides TaxID=299321 RepID=UPI0010A44988|nr:T-box transcription factor T-A-like [Denticeps clupeoides]